MSASLAAKTITWLERCERWVWLELHGDHAQQVADSPVSAKRAAAGLVHEAAVMAAMLKPAQPIEVPDWPALVRETRRLMHEGAAEIRQAGLEVRLAEGLRLRGRPDLLRRNNEARRVRL